MVVEGQQGGLEWRAGREDHTRALWRANREAWVQHTVIRAIFFFHVHLAHPPRPLPRRLSRTDIEK